MIWTWPWPGSNNIGPRNPDLGRKVGPWVLTFGPWVLTFGPSTLTFWPQGPIFGPGVRVFGLAGCTLALDKRLDLRKSDLGPRNPDLGRSWTFGNRTLDLEFRTLAPGPILLDPRSGLFPGGKPDSDLALASEFGPWPRVRYYWTRGQDFLFSGQPDSDLALARVQ